MREATARLRSGLIFEQQRLLIEEYRSQGRELAAYVDKLQRQVAQQEKLNERARDYIDHVSHEFRTPLAVVNDYLAILQRGLAGPLTSEQEYLFDAIATHAGELTRLVEDILDIRRLEIGAIKVRRQACRVLGIVERVKALTAHKAKFAKTNVTWPQLDQLPLVFCDDEKVGRALSNLVTNAIKFCGTPGEVTVRATVESGFLRLAVADNGQGIARADVLSLFEQFRQGDSQDFPAASAQGFGLGLGIARDLVRLNFGEMHVESELGEGSEFSFTVPLAKPEAVFHSYSNALMKTVANDSKVRLFRVQSTRPDCPRSLVESMLTGCLHPFDLLLPSSDGDFWLLAVDRIGRNLPSKLKAIQAKRHEQTLPEIQLDPMASCSPAAIPEVMIRYRIQLDSFLPVEDLHGS